MAKLAPLRSDQGTAGRSYPALCRVADRAAGNSDARCASIPPWPRTAKGYRASSRRCHRANQVVDQRQNRGRQQAGEVRLTKVSAAGVEQAVLHTYPDRVGELAGIEAKA